MKVRSKWQAIAEARCPRCGEGKMFSHSVLSPTNFDKMNSNCSHCGLRYEVEPGFFIGSMYVSYVITVGMMLVTGFLLYNFAGDPPTWVYVSSVIALILLGMPIIFRMSRVLYTYMFSGVSYEPLEHKQKV